jgi:hypothetical protein
MMRNPILEERRKKIPNHIDEKVRKWFDDRDARYSVISTPTTEESYEGRKAYFLKAYEEACFPRFDIINRWEQLKHYFAKNNSIKTKDDA